MTKTKDVMLKKNILAFLTLLVIGAACGKVPVTGRRQYNLLPESEVKSMALTEYKTFLTQSQVVSSGAQADMVKRVGQKLAAATEKFMKENGAADRVAGYQWEFNLVESKEMNAWCMPGGKIVFYTGILPMTQDENGMAVVMGHEIAHAVARHGNERMSQGLTAQLGGVALDVALSQKSAETRQLFQTAYGAGAQYGVILPFSRKHESEADKLGLIFMAVAGYDPKGAVGFWQRMKSASQGAPPEFMSTHPSDDRRIKDIQAYLPKAMKYYTPQ